MNKIEKFYNKIIYKYASSHSGSLLLKKELNLFLSNLPKNTAILDIGSGLGQDTEYFTKHGYLSIGIDVSKEMIKYALDTDKSGLFLKADFFKVYRVFPNRFGGVWIASSILTNYPKKGLDKFFSIAKKILIPNGIIGIIVREDKFRKLPLLHNNFSKNEISKLITENGFKIIKIKAISLKKSKWIFVLSKLPASKYKLNNKQK